MVVASLYSAFVDHLLEPGSYDVELEVSRGDEVVTFPSESYERLTVVRDLN